jgi:hypothetical protein
MNARNRALALELCRMLGLIEKSLDLVSYPDLTGDESQVLLGEEQALHRVADWLASRSNASDTVKSVNDFLRISGRYTLIKENI